jgi:hypothetical protein
MAEEWRAFDDAGKDPYMKMALKEKERYELELKAYNEKKKSGKDDKPKEEPHPEPDKKEDGVASAKKSAEKKA